jgi:hypothetical protein
MDQKTYNPPLQGGKSITILQMMYARKKKRERLCIVRDEGRTNQKLENL